MYTATVCLLIINHVALAKQGDNVLGSIRQSVCALTAEQRAKKSHYQSRVFVCVSNNCAYVVNQLLMICKGFKGTSSQPSVVAPWGFRHRSLASKNWLISDIRMQLFHKWPPYNKGISKVCISLVNRL